MSSGIFIIKSGDQLIELKEKDYDSEVILQGLLGRHPSSLAEIDEVIKEHSGWPGAFQDGEKGISNAR
jgi:hypothetical protein